MGFPALHNRKPWSEESSLRESEAGLGSVLPLAVLRANTHKARNGKTVFGILMGFAFGSLSRDVSMLSTYLDQ